MPKPDEETDLEFEASLQITKHQKATIMMQNLISNPDTEKIKFEKREITLRKEKRIQDKYDVLFAEANPTTQRALKCAREKGASSWLTFLPLENLGYSVNQEEFRDALALRYNWRIDDVPKHCGCGQTSDIDHLLSCKLGGYVAMRHDKLRDTVATFLKEVCHDVRTEPALLVIGNKEHFPNSANTSDNARLDVSARGVWAPFDRTFFDIRVSHPNCPSNANRPLEQIYRLNEQEKKRQYNERVMSIEKGTFTPLVLTTTGGMSNECTALFRRVAGLMARKSKDKYADVLRHIRVRTRVALLKSTLIALRGFRGKPQNREDPIEDITFSMIPTPSTMTQQ